jgi:hypothetical protein
VRQAATYVYGNAGHEPWRLTLALTGCLPGDIGTLESIFDRVTYFKNAPQDTTVTLRRRDLALTRRVILGSAQVPHVNGHDLSAVLDRVLDRAPRLAVEWAWARVAWLRINDAPDLELVLSAPEPFPDEVRAAIRAAADDDDCRAVLDLLEERSLAGRGEGAARDLLEIIDDGSAIVTERLGHWLTSGNDDLAYEARVTLGHTGSSGDASTAASMEGPVRRLARGALERPLLGFDPRRQDPRRPQRA